MEILPSMYPAAKEYSIWVRGTNLKRLLSSVPQARDISIFQWTSHDFYEDRLSNHCLKSIQKEYRTVLSNKLDRKTRGDFSRQLSKSVHVPNTVLGIALGLSKAAEVRGYFPEALRFLDLADRLTPDGPARTDHQVYLDIHRARIIGLSGNPGLSLSLLESIDLSPYADSNDSLSNDLYLRACIEKIRVAPDPSSKDRAGVKEISVAYADLFKMVTNRNKDERSEFKVPTPIEYDLNCLAMIYFMNLQDFQEALTRLSHLRELVYSPQEKYGTGQDPLDLPYLKANTEYLHALLIERSEGIAIPSLKKVTGHLESALDYASKSKNPLLKKQCKEIGGRCIVYSNA